MTLRVLSRAVPCLLALACLCQRRADAQPAASAVNLEWSAPATCPSQGSVLSEVDRVLGPFRDAAAHVSARAEVTLEPQGAWHATLLVETPGALRSRSFGAESCAALASATALILAIAVDGRAAQRLPERLAAAEPTRPAAAASSGSAKRVATRASPERSPGAISGLDLAIGADADEKLLPEAAIGGELAFGWVLEKRSWRIRMMASAALLAPQTARLGTGESATFWLFAASGRVCPSLAMGRIDVGPCAGAELDSMWASDAHGPALFTPHLRGAVWSSLFASILGTWNVSGSLSIFARVDGLVPLERPGFDIQRTPPPDLQVHRPPAVAARETLGLEVRFF